jgi:hypothetical protein
MGVMGIAAWNRAGRVCFGVLNEAQNAKNNYFMR